MPNDIEVQAKRPKQARSRARARCRPAGTHAGMQAGEARAMRTAPGNGRLLDAVAAALEARAPGLLEGLLRLRVLGLGRLLSLGLHLLVNLLLLPPTPDRAD